MGGLSPIHIVILLLVVVLLLGKGKVSGLMGDIAQGIKAFKKNMADDHQDASMSTPGPNSGTVPTSKIAQDDIVKPAPLRDPVQPS